MRFRCARASLRSSEESSERERFRGGPSTEGEGDGAEDEDGDGREEECSKDGLTVVADIVDVVEADVEIRGLGRGGLRNGLSCILAKTRG